MEKLGKSFESLSEERRALLPRDDRMAQSERREVLVNINGQDSLLGQRRSNVDDMALVYSADSTSFRGTSSFLLRSKTKSRLMDPPELSQKQVKLKNHFFLNFIFQFSLLPYNLICFKNLSISVKCLFL